MLEEIQAFLEEHTSPFTKVKVQNPRYEHICYRMDIRFQKGLEAEFNYLQKELNEALKRFLSPWAFEKGADISFGSRIYNAAVIHFIEKLPYVDYVVNFKLVQQYLCPSDKRGCVTYDNWAEVRFPDSILVSAEQHHIGPVKYDDYDPDDYKGIGYEIIGVDHDI